VLPSNQSGLSPQSAKKGEAAADVDGFGGHTALFEAVSALRRPSAALPDEELGASECSTTEPIGGKIPL
jgi:hypothetical protein